MRNSEKVWWYLLVTVMLAAFFCFSVSAEESEYPLPEGVANGYDSMLSALPESLRKQLPQNLFSRDGEEIESAVTEMLTPSFLWNMISETIDLHIGDAFAFLLEILGILLLSSVFGAISRALRGTGGRVVGMISSSAILLLVIDRQSSLVEGLSSYFSALTGLAGGMVPVMGALYAIGGNFSGAATGSAMMSVFLAVSELIGGRLLLPTVGALMGLATVPIFSPSLCMRSLSSCIKRTFTFCLGFLMMLLSALLAMRAGLAAKADSVGARAIKYVASSMIPVVGGSIADSLRTVGAGVEYLRGTLGVAGILLIVLLLLPFLVDLLLFRAVLILAASAAEILGCDTETKLLNETVGVYGYALAVSVMCAVMFIFALTILVRTASAVG